ncbi:MAG: deoxyribodipyrimidine photo-lyase [Pseudodesulfovibrio sp.]|uniref:Deoxyribodipyrimidine photo-lyase n=1 Tax=Pseudodesulfovibrio aespoeensis (strain ATCC 700646 / DSM 10631 / Aspo-2) TaxID=643562 RepID=E6VUF5_PSEA9|nr:MULTISPECIES: deoxyribodipyrimidine photo-lyase [Pseudodesulfovibrio]MBU4193108.1 deoxyribodipyrimidine photo-lyase [Pseudomonadota bacterium]ADU61100.1 deoxyribodipyrimidine photolyase [Pseudodesulfovibrio aespoeensis Aspo-2]MBU4244118.1 deoxyribodipyrimidine photo-lyase [Pseudomonadota bacterium]MBU4378722.1 deoxyribodipyrimidine photo-lyase [Pseudomonadota bacterium]MBU4476479.1 deoxyribodipyrimidine photo-lyase [Pseudomonadota bacterium]
MLVNNKRLYRLNQAPLAAGPILYWMSREQRVRDNWGLLHAREMAGQEHALVVVFCLAPAFLGATLRQYDFMLSGLAQVEGDLAALGIPFVLLQGDPGQEIPRLAAELGAGGVVTDFDPLRVKQGWQGAAAHALPVSFIEVDGHNVVPARQVSPKQEYAARTIRPKIHRLIGEYLEEFPPLEPQVAPAPPCAATARAAHWGEVRAGLAVDGAVGPVSLVPGEDAAHDALDRFVADRLHVYAGQRNDPNADGTSRLSAYFHFGQLAPQRAALAAAASGRGEGQAAYLEELVVRRELADNFCLHNPQYDSLAGAPAWALKTLGEHRADPRAHCYTRETFEQARTGSRLWNAAQNELRQTGFMHGYMRMFWAKKILEWSATPEEAHATALALNDRYQLDGRDPNGYVGILWSLAGLHDRPWQTRPVFGSVRFMNENGCRRKFDVDKYIERWGGS